MVCVVCKFGRVLYIVVVIPTRVIPVIPRLLSYVLVLRNQECLGRIYAAQLSFEADKRKIHLRRGKKLENYRTGVMLQLLNQLYYYHVMIQISDVSSTVRFMWKRYQSSKLIWFLGFHSTNMTCFTVANTLRFFRKRSSYAKPAKLVLQSVSPSLTTKQTNPRSRRGYISAKFATSKN
jgi:hypothetical protein